MNNKTRYWPLLLVFNMMLFTLVSSGEIHNNTNNNEPETIDINSLSGTLSSQIDNALQLIDTNPEKAQILAKSALQTAQSEGNKNIEMQSYFVLGRVSTISNNNKLALAYLDTALTIAEHTDDSWYQGEILYRTGALQHRLGDNLQALETFNNAIQACRLAGHYKMIGSSYSIMGSIFRMNGFYDRAIEYVIKAKLNYEKANFLEGDAWSAYLLSLIYSDLKSYSKALEYIQQSLEVYTELAKLDGQQSGLALCYEQLGLINLNLGNFDEARMHIAKTKEIYSTDLSKTGMSSAYKNMGKIAYYSGDYPLAKEYLNKALALKKELGYIPGLASIYEYLGLCLIKTNHIKEGFATIQQGLDWAIKNDQKKIQLDIYSKLTETYLSLKDLNNALDCQKKQIQIQNIILSGGANIKTEQLQTIYEIDEKNSQIDELEKQNAINALEIKQNQLTRNIMIGGIVVAFIVAFIISWFYTKLRHKNHELNETNASKDKFFAIIAHDLRGPTGALASFLAHLNSNFDEFSKNELKDILVTLHKSAENVSFLLENLLIWAQSQVKRIEFNPAKLNLNDEIENTVQGLQQFAANKQINIKQETQKSVFIKADPNMIQTIVRNILGNAIKFSHRGGEVIIRSALKNKHSVLVEIIDNGVGIDKLRLTKIFDICYKQHTNGTENEKSTGLGLILVKEFVEKNNGTLSIESETEKGTTVSFTIPVA
ncbi:tetratricopeptide repeat protein [Prolixibacteraceae bacterium Z1-6]|uniref:histidine kinase n=1 Tax=Draconibacterium aestuarii TaxID=2998507 RepID=A0A9X3F5G1_9BACT|nr:tetratricopeptide repeat protein [Prolixibacteraceae bacterium Z1-6]